MAGQTLLEEERMVETTHTLNLENLVTGHCILRIESAEGVFVEKILVSK